MTAEPQDVPVVARKRGRLTKEEAARRNAIVVECLARGMSQQQAFREAGYSENYCLKASKQQRNKMAELEDKILEAREKLLKSRTGLIPMIKAIERANVKRIKKKYRGDEKLDRVDVELFKTIKADVNRAVGLDEKSDQGRQSVNFITVHLGEAMGRAYNWDDDVIDVAPDDPGVV